MTHRCVCFTTDIGYLFPTILCAIQARRHTGSEVADIIIVLFVPDGASDELFLRICSEKGIKPIVVDPHILRGFTTMYARLFLEELLPAHYTEILYLDGDIQIAAPLDGVLMKDLAEGRAFAAVPDPMAVELTMNDERASNILGYLQGLGVSSTLRRPYFNSGAMRISRAGWVAVSRDALKFLREKPALCRYQDQSALNFAGHAVFEPMSFKWNFPIFFRNCGVEAAIEPAIYHFMSKPKPWEGNFRPWSARFCAPYDGLMAEYPGLKTYVKAMSAKRRLKYHALQNFKMIQETLVWRFSPRRRAILEFDRAAGF